MTDSGLLALAATLTLTWAAAEPLVLNSFEDEASLDILTPHTAKIGLADEHATEGSKALAVRFGVADWPNVFFAAGEAYQTLDWRPYGAFVFDAYNPEDEPLRINVRIDDDSKADGRVHCRQTGVNLPPKRQVTVSLAIYQQDLQMRGAPPAGKADVNGSLGTRELDLSHIIAFQFFLARPTAEHTVYIDNVRLAAGSAVEGIVDRFGQYTGADWPGKAHQEQDLAARREQEAAELAAAALPPERDEWGGWAAGPQLEATGWFRVEKVRDKWWLVTPTGHLFWSMGLDCVRPSNSGPIKGREHMFTWLPEKGEPLYEFGGRGANGVNFYGVNLHRKYGPDWLDPWLDVTRRRMLAWGFNTVGNWSDDRSYANLKLPYAVPIHYGGAPGFPGGWRDIPDFYSDKWAEGVEKKIKAVTDKWREDPCCIGYFVDNELSWGGWGSKGRYALPVNALALTGDREVKQAFTRLLRDKYETIARLNEAWGAGFASWESFLSDPVVLPKGNTDAMRSDLGMLLADFARRYFSVVSALMSKYAPNQLYLGPRFAVAPEEVVMVGKDYCDVVSHNIYGRAPNILSRGRQIEKLDKPVLIGEFHFGALDRGMFHGGLGPVPSQEDRGIQYAEYIKTALDQPWCVGAHWFIYVDQSLTGRFDGENYNIGFVSGTDTPYPELISHAKEINFAIYDRRGR